MPLMPHPTPLQRIAFLAALALAGCKTVVMNCPAPVAANVPSHPYITAPNIFTLGSTTAECTPEKCPGAFYSFDHLKDPGIIERDRK